MKKTKIICTMGPNTENEDTLREMIIAGMDVARFNFSHGTHEEQLTKFNLLKKVREELNIPHWQAGGGRAGMSGTRIRIYVDDTRGDW